jgi:ribosomal protein S27AE
MSWGVVILIHTGYVFISNFMERALEARLAFHATITLVTSAYLIWNDWFQDHQLEWILFAVVPLVLIWLNHLIVYRLFKPKYHKVTGEIVERSIFTKMIDAQVKLMGENFEGDKREAARKIVINRIILRNHIIIYAAVNIFLFFLNLRQGLDSPWFLWSTLSWGLTILIHSFVYLNYKRHTMEKRMTRKYFLVYPATISLYLVITDVLSDGIFDWFWWAVVPIVMLSLIVAQIMGRRHVKKINLEKPETPISRREGNLQQSQNVHVQRVAKASTRFCPSCGKKVLAHHKFCQGCGYDLGKT